MLRNCPHCRVDQYVGDEKVTTEVVFLKCHHCGEIATLRGPQKPKVSASVEVPVEKPAVSEFLTPSFSIATAGLSPTQFSSISLSATPAPTEPKPEPVRPDPVPVSVAQAQPASFFRTNGLTLALALVCLGSGGYLLHSVSQLRQESDLVQNQEAQALPREDRAPAVVHRIDLAQTPSKPAEVPEKAPEQRVTVKKSLVVLRSGPGKEYKKVGSAKAELQLVVTGQFDNWFEVKTETGTAWIRNDLVSQSSRSPASSQEAK